MGREEGGEESQNGRVTGTEAEGCIHQSSSFVYSPRFLLRRMVGPKSHLDASRSINGKYRPCEGPFVRGDNPGTGLIESCMNCQKAAGVG